MQQIYLFKRIAHLCSFFILYFSCTISYSHQLEIYGEELYTESEASFKSVPVSPVELLIRNKMAYVVQNNKTLSQLTGNEYLDLPIGIDKEIGGCAISLPWIAVKR